MGTCPKSYHKFIFIMAHRLWTMSIIMIKIAHLKFLLWQSFTNNNSKPLYTVQAIDTVGTGNLERVQQQIINQIKESFMCRIKSKDSTYISIKCVNFCKLVWDFEYNFHNLRREKNHVDIVLCMVYFVAFCITKIYLIDNKELQICYSDKSIVYTQFVFIMETFRILNLKIILK